MVCSTSLLLFLAISATAAVRFDVQPLASAIEVPDTGAIRQMPASRLVQIQFEVSTIVPPEFQGAFDEAMVKMVTRKPSVQVADYWPRTEMYSSIATPLAVAENYERDRQASIQGVGGYPGVGSASGYAYFRDELHRDVHYQQQPPMQLLTASGTIDRRSGVYFKLRSTPQAVLEGSRRFLLTLEVPNDWRGDVLEFHAVAYGRKNPDSSQGHRQLGEARFLVAVYNQGDQEAAEDAMTFVQQQARLRDMANQYASKIQKQAYPTPVHKLGQALDIYEPSVPRDYLNQWIFGSPTEQPNRRLPVDLRVAMLDFIDSRAAIEALAGSPQATSKSKMALANHASSSY
jgi:hypothetical protein